MWVAKRVHLFGSIFGLMLEVAFNLPLFQSNYGCIEICMIPPKLFSHRFTLFYFISNSLPLILFKVIVVPAVVALLLDKQ